MKSDMNNSKYKAILAFFNAFASSKNLPQCKTFTEIAEKQLAVFIEQISTEDSVTDISFTETDAVSNALELLRASDTIDFASETSATTAKDGDEPELGKILIGVLFMYQCSHSKTFESLVSQLKNGSSDQIRHIVNFLQDQENWPPEGWPAILTLPLTESFFEKQQSTADNVSESSFHISPIKRTPSRYSARHIRTPYRASPIHKMFSPAQKSKQQQQITRLETEIQACRTIIAESDKRYELMTEEKIKLQEHCRKLEAKLERANEDIQTINSLTFERDEACREREQLRKKAADLTKENNLLASEYNDLNKTFQSVLMDAEAAESKATLLEQEKVKIEGELRDIRDEHMEMQTRYDDLLLTHQRLEDNYNRITKELMDERHLQQERRRMSRANVQIGDIREAELKISYEKQIENMIAEHSEEKEMLQEEISALKLQIQEQELGNKAQLEKDLALLQSEIKKIKENHSETFKELQKKSIEVETLKQDLEMSNSQMLEYKLKASNNETTVEVYKETLAECRLKCKRLKDECEQKEAEIKRYEKINFVKEQYLRHESMRNEWLNLMKPQCEAEPVLMFGKSLPPPPPHM